MTSVETARYLRWKRAFDVSFALLALTVMAPVLAVIALAIRLTSPGPALFVQSRVGRKGKIFRMYKFRTMRRSPETESDRLWTAANDPRCTRFGAFLRRSSLDELPQFFNVLRGDMSVVGPRPERPFFCVKFTHEIRRYSDRLRLQAGITGWAQVHGYRGDTSMRRRVACDLYYLRHWSFLLDLRIIFRTLCQGFFNPNAY